MLPSCDLVCQSTPNTTCVGFAAFDFDSYQILLPCTQLQAPVLLLDAQVSVGVAGLALGYYTLLREPVPANIKSDTENCKHRGLPAGDAAALGLRAVLPGTVGALPRQPSSGSIVDELDAETKRTTSGEYWKQKQQSQQDH